VSVELITPHASRQYSSSYSLALLVFVFFADLLRRSARRSAPPFCSRICPADLPADLLAALLR
jgi:hypothetical protein